jgi:DNA-directed RNA polymerase specialized sigma24 family protein
MQNEDTVTYSVTEVREGLRNLFASDADPDVAADIWNALMHLTPATRKKLIRWAAGYSYDEIGPTYKAAQQAMSRGLRHMQRVLNGTLRLPRPAQVR